MVKALTYFRDFELLSSEVGFLPATRERTHEKTEILVPD
jgi:hypothetical protein